MLCTDNFKIKIITGKQRSKSVANKVRGKRK